MHVAYVLWCIGGSEDRMTWQLTVQEALFLLSLIIFGIMGYQRGWQRETVSLLFIILGVGFLDLNGGAYLSKLLYQFLLGRSISEKDLLRSHPNVWIFVTIAGLLVVIVFGYILLIRRPTRKSGQERVLRFISGLMTGAVIAADLTYFLLPNRG